MPRKAKTHRRLQRSTRKFNWRTLKFDAFNEELGTFSGKTISQQEGKIKAELNKMERDQKEEYGTDLFL